MSGRKQNSIEPGLIRVFQWFSVLRIILFFAALIGNSQLQGARENLSVETDVTPWIVLVILIMIFQALFLYWKPGPDKLGKWYLPIALGTAALSLLIEPYFLTPFTRLWQPDYFLFVLLILVAWQYPFGVVTLFILLNGGAEILVRLYVPRGNIEFFSRGIQATEQLIFFGRIFARTTSLFVLGFVINRLVTAGRLQREELENANQRLLEHSFTLEHLATSRERNRISRELHDTLAHTLSALSVQLEALISSWKRIPKNALIMIETMLQTTREGLNETRRTLKNLRATPLEELGLKLAIATLATEFSDRNGWDLELNISEKDDEISSEIDQTFYRIAQEGLENIARHASASEVLLSLSSNESSAILKIKDNGTGFNLNDNEEIDHLGLRLMRERADLLGAKLSIQSEPGKGTVLKLERNT